MIWQVVVLLMAAASGDRGVSEARPSVAITVPTSAAPADAWIGYAIADGLTNRLLVHSRVDPKNLQRIYPLNVFGWRQAQSAARGDGIELEKDRDATGRLLEQLGADCVFVGSYSSSAKDVTLTWRLSGSSQPKSGTLRFETAGLVEATEQLATEILTLVASGASALGGHKQAPLPLAAMKPFGEALSILGNQSLDPRARLVLPAADVARAHAMLSASTDAAPSFVRAWVERGVASAMLNELSRAEEELVQALAHGDEFEPTTALGTYYLYDRQNKLGEGIKVLADATSTHLGFLQGLGYLGEAYLRAGHPHESLKVFTSYSTRVPKSPWAKVKRGAALSRIGKPELAVDETRAVFERLPHSLMVAVALISRQIDAKDLKGAHATLARAQKDHPNHPALITRASFLALEEGNAEAALELAQRAVTLLGDGRGEPLAGYAHVNLAHALALQKRRDEAVAALKRALELGVGGEELGYLRRDARIKDFLRDARLPPRVLAIEH